MSWHTPGRCPELRRDPASVHRFVAAHAQTLPDFSPRLAFGCRSGATRQEIIARNFTAALLRCIDLSRHTPERCPGFHRGPAFGCRSGAAEQNLIARNFAAALLSVVAPARQNRISLPETSPRPASVHRFVAAHARTLPGFSPRNAFGCRSGAAKQEIIARNFTAALLRCMDLSRHTPGHCPGFHRALLSVVAPARQNRISLPGTSPRSCFRLSLRRGRI